MAVLDAYKNLALAQILTPPAPAASGTSLTLMTGQGAYLPTPPFNGTVFSGASFPTPTTAEIVRVTALAGDVATIVRQQEGTSARTIQANDYLAATFTTKFVTDVTDSSNQAAGTLPDARLSATVTRRDQANTFTADPQVFQSASNYGRVLLRDASQAADQRLVQVINNSGQLSLTWVNDAGTVNSTPLALILDRIGGHAHVGGTLFEQGRATAMGFWTAIPFNANNFSSDSGTFVVASGNVNAFAYTLVGKTLTLQCYIGGATITGAPSLLLITLPSPFQMASAAVTAATVADGQGYSAAWVVYSGPSVLKVILVPGRAFLATTNTMVAFTISTPVF